MKLFTAVALTLSIFAVSTTAAPIASPVGLGDLFGGLENVVPLGGSTGANADTESLSNPSVGSTTDAADPASFARRGLGEFLGGLGNAVPLGGSTGANAADTESLASPSLSSPSVESTTDAADPASLARRGLGEFLGGLGNVVPVGGSTGANVADTESLASPSLSSPSVESTTDAADPASLARRGLGEFLEGLGNAVPLGGSTGANAADTESLASPSLSSPSVESTAGAADPAALARRGLGEFLGGLGNVVPVGGSTGANVADTESLASPSLSNPSVESTTGSTPDALTRRGLIPVDINAIVDVLVKVNTEVIVKAITELKVNVCADIHSKLHLAAQGLLTTDTDVVIPKISAKVDSETRVIVNTKVDLDTKAIVISNIGEHARKVIHKHCPHEDAICISKAAGDIVADVEALVKLDIDRLFIALKTNLMIHVRAKLQVLIRELGLNLIVEQIHIQGFVDAVADVDVHLDLCAHVIVKGLHVTVVATAVAAIKSLLGL
ncbi:hypothetical protein EC957_003252 [Mortierella hygrophila]|uniref:Uncharacterized protein n=1 Tax=Mortierella hygrophila TaxID=979708 RepID=A0A9P6K1C6_9FUNG|nr:hypothetical protein EC957_003252 [Mortierella hygrophila]